MTAAAWSYTLAVAAAAGTLAASLKPKVGWAFNLATIPAWIGYWAVTRQWAFVPLMLIHGASYAVLLRRAYRDTSTSLATGSAP